MPVVGPIHVDRPLTNISIAYKSEGLVADQVFASVPVSKESDTYFVWDKANALRSPQTLRANGAEANEDNLVLSTATYRIEEHALKDLITTRDRENQDPGVNLEIATTEDLTEKILREREVDAATLLFTNGNWANESSLAAASAFSANTVTTNPLLVVNSAAATVVQQIGKPMNTGILDFRTYLACKEHVSILDRTKHTSADSITEDMLGNLFDVEKLYIAKATRNTAAEGAAATMAYIFTDSGWFGYVERNPGLRKVSALYCMKKNGGVQVKRWHDDARNGDWVEASHFYDQIVPASDAGYLIVDPVQ